MEWLLYRNGSEAVEDGGGFVDKRNGSVEEMVRFGRWGWSGSVNGDSGSVEGMEQFGRGRWGGSCVIVYICIGDAGR